MSDKTHDSLRLSCNPQDIFMWYEGEIDKLKSEIAQLKSQQKEQFSREDMINAYIGGFEQADNYANENGAGPENWLTEYLNSKPL